MRILLVEDEKLLADTIAEGLRRLSMAVDVCYDGEQALERVGVHGYDVVVLDRDLPKVHGDEVCVAIGDGQHDSRVLMLTAAGEVGERVAGLALGADDYLPKPFAFAELVARIQALSRRVRPALPPVLSHGDVVLDPLRHQASRGGRFLSLSPKEFAVLEVLLRADGAVVTAEDLLEKAWDEHTNPFTNTVRVTMMTLRKKLGDPAVIHTVQGVGYRLAS